MPIFNPCFIGYLDHIKGHTSTLKRLYVTVGTRHYSRRRRRAARGAGGPGRGGVGPAL